MAKKAPKGHDPLFHQATWSRPGRDLTPQTIHGHILIDFGLIFHRFWMILEGFCTNMKRFFDDLPIYFGVYFFTEFSDYRPSVERRLPIIKKVLWQSQQHLQEGFRPMGVLDRVLCPGAFLSYNPARGAPEPMIHGPRPTTPTNNKNVPSLIRPGGMRACALNNLISFFLHVPFHKTPSELAQKRC